MSRQRTKKILRISITSLIILAVAGYAVFAFHDFILGPRILLDEPQNGESFATSSISIRGTVYRSQDITLNGKSIFIDEQGHFKETTLLSPGYNALTLTARDKFGRNKEYRLELVYKVN